VSDATLQTGDIVVLRSGGPKMTVESAGPDGVMCVWFDGKQPRAKSFAAVMLHTHEEKLTIRIVLVGGDGDADPEQTLDEFRAKDTNWGGGSRSGRLYEPSGGSQSV
jgi:uncharacterized protein YodC (DUF2158 family)